MAALLLAGCQAITRGIDETHGWSAARLYAEARNEMNGRNWERALRLYRLIESRFPYGRYAQQAMLESAYVHWRDNEPAQALATVDRFLKLYPTNPHVDYALYLKGRISFNDELGFIGQFLNTDVSERDPRGAREAFDAFRELVTRFPDSRYAPDAAARMKFLVNMMATSEINVARFYYRRGAFVAAVNRAQFALTTYPQAPANEEGLAIMIRAYEQLGLTELRNDAERVMKQNFPNSRYFKGLTPDRPWWRPW